MGMENYTEGGMAMCLFVVSFFVDYSGREEESVVVTEKQEHIAPAKHHPVEEEDEGGEAKQLGTKERVE